jgi:hypothetical protein
LNDVLLKPPPSAPPGKTDDRNSEGEKSKATVRSESEPAKGGLEQGKKTDLAYPENEKSGDGMDVDP